MNAGNEYVIDMNELAYYLGIGRGSVISFVGSGGKTTLMEALAGALGRVCRVCVGTTTKILAPQKGETLVLAQSYPKDLAVSAELLTIEHAQMEAPGIVYAADSLVDDGKKLHGFSPRMMAWARANTDVILLEADGAHMRPLKGWSEYEPVICEETNMTIGILPVHLIGRIIDETIIHRPEHFFSVTKAGVGDVLTIEHMVRLISHPHGLFGKAQGEKVLFFSQVNCQEREDIANAIVDAGTFDRIDKIIIGCVKP